MLCLGGSLLSSLGSIILIFFAVLERRSIGFGEIFFSRCFLCSFISSRMYSGDSTSRSGWKRSFLVLPLCSREAVALLVSATILVFLFPCKSLLICLLISYTFFGELGVFC